MGQNLCAHLSLRHVSTFEVLSSTYTHIYVCSHFCEAWQVPKMRQRPIYPGGRAVGTGLPSHKAILIFRKRFHNPSTGLWGLEGWHLAVLIRESWCLMPGLAQRTGCPVLIACVEEIELQTFIIAFCMFSFSKNKIKWKIQPLQESTVCTFPHL